MNTQEVKSLFGQIFHEVAPEIEFEKLDTSKSLRSQVEIDSFDFYRIMVQVTKRTGINVPDSRLADMKNLDQLIEYISEPPNHRQPSASVP